MKKQILLLSILFCSLISNVSFGITITVKNATNDVPAISANLIAHCGQTYMYYISSIGSPPINRNAQYTFTADQIAQLNRNLMGHDSSCQASRFDIVALVAPFTSHLLCTTPIFTSDVIWVVKGSAPNYTCDLEH